MTPSIGSFGVGVLSGTRLDGALDIARDAERLGFGTFWVAEDYYYGGAFATAAAVASVTDRIRIGIGVVNPFTRHPAVVAMEAGAIDSLSRGRLILGLGSSNARWIEEEMGIPFARPLTATRESLEIVRRLMAGERLTYNGRQFHVNDVALSFEPARKKLPIWLGAKGPTALRVAGAIADGVLLSVLSSVEYIRWARARIAEGAAEAGRNVTDLELGAYVLVNPDENEERSRAPLRPVVAHYMGIHNDHAIMREAGFSPEEMAVFRKALVEGGDARESVTDRMLDTLAIAGSPVECGHKIEALFAAGLTHAVCFQIPGVPFARTLAVVREHLARSEGSSILTAPGSDQATPSG